MFNELMENKIIELRNNAKEKLQIALNDTTYLNKKEEILSDYMEFLKIGIVSNLINEKNIDIYSIEKIVYNEKGNAYASWRNKELTLQPRFFLERNREEQRNVIFHELIHALMDELILSNNNANNFINFCFNIDDYLTKEELDIILLKFKDIIELNNNNLSRDLACEINWFINESTTQNLAEILTAKSFNKTREEYAKFESKILTDSSILKSNFATYPEFQQVFNYFLRTINGLGTIENDEELFLEYFKLLQSGTIWQQIIGTYFEKNKIPDLFEFFMTMSVLKRVKDSSMGINVNYNGDKEKLTQLINSLCIKMNELRNNDELKEYPYVEFKIKSEPILLIGKRIKPKKS